MITISEQEQSFWRLALLILKELVIDIFHGIWRYGWIVVVILFYLGSAVYGLIIAPALTVGIKNVVIFWTSLFFLIYFYFDILPAIKKNPNFFKELIMDLREMKVSIKKSIEVSKEYRDQNQEETC